MIILIDCMPSIDPTQSNNILQDNVPTLERDAPEQKTCEERGRDEIASLQKRVNQRRRWRAWRRRKSRRAEEDEEHK